MLKNKIHTYVDFDMDFMGSRNRKRSQRWLSEETKLLNKYGMGSRYLAEYVL